MAPKRNNEESIELISAMGIEQFSENLFSITLFRIFKAFYFFFICRNV